MNGIINPEKIRPGQRLQLPGEVIEVPGVIHTSEGFQRVGKERVRISIEHDAVYATPLVKPKKIFVGRQHRKGLYRVGLWEPETFIANHREKLQEVNLTDSEVNVILATSENEGNLDAVNTWDTQFISFGMFQWTAGGSGKLTAADMSAAGDDEEQLLIKNYLDVRETYGKWPMADARQRAAVTRGYAVDGVISANRGSFVSSKDEKKGG